MPTANPIDRAERDFITPAAILFAGDILRGYPHYRESLQELERLRQEIAESYPVSTWQERTQRSGISDPTAAAAFRLLRLETSWRRIRFYVQAIGHVMQILPPERRRLVELHFWEGHTAAEVQGMLFIGKSNFYAWRQGILILLAQRLGL